MGFKAWLNEIAGVTDTGEKVPAELVYKLLEPYAKPWHYMTYMTMERPLANNPKYAWDFSPQAIYGYSIMKLFQGGKFTMEPYGFGTDRPLITVFKVKEGARDKVLDVAEFDKAVEGAIMKVYAHYVDQEPPKEELIEVAKKAHPLAPMIIDNAQKVMGLENFQFYNLFTSISKEIDRLAYDPSKKKQLGMRNLLIQLGLRGVQVGPHSEAGKIPNEAYFFYATDLEPLKQFINKKDFMGIKATWNRYDKKYSYDQQRHGHTKGYGLVSKLRDAIDKHNMKPNDLNNIIRLLISARRQNMDLGDWRGYWQQEKRKELLAFNNEEINKLVARIDSLF